MLQNYINHNSKKYLVFKFKFRCSGVFCPVMAEYVKFFEMLPRASAIYLFAYLHACVHFGLLHNQAISSCSVVKTSLCYY
jgi:hypothetical protein